MKTKLLRKVRKRYSIYWHPNGIQIGELYHKIPCYQIEGFTKKDSLFFDYPVFVGDPEQNELAKIIYGYHRFFGTQEEAYKAILDDLKYRILNKYSKFGTRRIALRNLKEKLWYK